MKHKKRRHKHHDARAFNGFGFMKEVEEQMEREGMFLKEVPDQAVMDLIEIGESAFAFIRMSSLDSRAKKAFMHLEKQFAVCRDVVVMGI